MSTPKNPLRLAGSERAPLAGAREIGPANPNETVDVTIRLRSRAGKKPIVSADASTKPIEKRSFLSRKEFEQSHGADPATIARVEAFAREHKLTVKEKSPERRTVILSGTVSANAVNLSYTPIQLATLYNFPTGVDGSGECIAIVELGGGFNPADLSSYWSQLNLPKTPNVSAVSVGNGSNSPTGDPAGPDGEVMLDIEVCGAIAPGAKIVVYFAENTDAGFLNAITTAVHDSVNNPSVLSISWGGPEPSWTPQAMTSMDEAFQAAGAMGVTVCVAAGDDGSTDGVGDNLNHVDFPASSPNVLACGGTTLVAAGNTVTSETVWNELANNEGATGGGISDVFPLPTWQNGVGVPSSANPNQNVGRGVPDVSGDADPTTGYVTLVDGNPDVIGGTSAVAPLWAGLIALINDSNQKPAGLINPLLYQGESKGTGFNDITSGNNGAYNAGPGWDACTGLGSPIGTQIAAVLGVPQQPALKTGT